MLKVSKTVVGRNSVLLVFLVGVAVVLMVNLHLAIISDHHEGPCHPNNDTPHSSFASTVRPPPPLPRPTTTTTTTTTTSSSNNITNTSTTLQQPELSACLIVMDDNHFLIEWIAYHYHTANLRHLIVVSDPQSVTKPTKILDRWRDRIVVEEWQETQFMPDDDDGRDVRNKTTLQNHRLRQASFYLECLRSLKQRGREWTMLLDIDEYLAVNQQVATAIATPLNLSTLLNKVQIPSADFKSLKTACLPIFRVQFSAKESSPAVINSGVPSGFDARHFQTLRWRYYGYNKSATYTTKIGETCSIRRWIPNKVIIDLGRLRLQDLFMEKHSGNPHQPLDICPKHLYLRADETPLMAHHYMGTPEQWFYRQGDKRGRGYRQARYEDLNEKIGTVETDDLRPWLADFVRRVGQKEAMRLLAKIGELESLSGGEVQFGLEEFADASRRDTAKFDVGDVIHAMYHGHGEWYWAEVSAVHSNGYYNVIYPVDCSEEIGTFDDNLRLAEDLPVTGDPENEEYRKEAKKA